MKAGIRCPDCGASTVLEASSLLGENVSPEVDEECFASMMKDVLSGECRSCHGLKRIDLHWIERGKGDLYGSFCKPCFIRISGEFLSTGLASDLRVFRQAGFPDEEQRCHLNTVTADNSTYVIDSSTLL